MRSENSFCGETALLTGLYPLIREKNPRIPQAIPLVSHWPEPGHTATLELQEQEEESHD